MERRYPLIDVGADTAVALLGRLPGAPRPRTFKLLTGGHINTSYVADLDDGQRIVLRIGAAGAPGLRKEVDLLRRLAGSVPVPRVHLLVADPQVFDHPYAVLEWIAGAALGELLASRPQAAPEIGDAVASALLQIAGHTLPAHPAPPFVEYVRGCLFDRGASHWIGDENTARLWSFVQQHGARLEAACADRVLVHGDFQGDNILLDNQTGHWQVRAVLDWEWAQEGCQLRDLGCLLRNTGEAGDAFERGIEAGFARRGAPLPSTWRRSARIWDLAANCEKLACPMHRGEVTARSILIIERCLSDYA
jgi:aminoglycoside phosphotransferase (APT) family kinase protein